MSDIVNQLRDWAATICTVRGTAPEGSKTKLARAAADEIERLRKERDYARQWVCQLLANPESVMHLAKPGNGTKRDFAAEQGWDCFKEGKP